MAAKYELDLDLKPSGIPQKIHLNQYDKGQTITIHLYNDDEIYTPVGRVWVSGTKKDNKGFQYQCEVKGSDVIVTVTDQMTVYHGDTEVEVSDVKEGMVQGSANFILSVEEAAFHDDTIISGTDIPAVQRVAEDIDKVESWKNAAETAADRAETALSSAQTAQTGAETAQGKAEEAQKATEQLKADTSDIKDEASNSAVLAESYAKGGTGTRDGEDTDNALYYKNLAETTKSDTEKIKSDTEKIKSDTSTLKSDVETLKSDTEKIKSDTESIKADTDKNLTLAKSYAVGGTGTREGENIDNAKAYAAQAKSAAEATASGMKLATETSTGAVKPDNETITIDSDGTLHGNSKITVDDALSDTSTNPVENKVIYQKFDETDKSIKDVSDNVSELAKQFNQFLEDGTVTLPLVNEDGDYLVTENGDILVATKKIGG